MVSCPPASLFHELTPWTVHVSRLNRPGVADPNRFGTECYSREELAAEMDAAFLCAKTGTDLTMLENQAVYISGWLRHIRNSSAADVIRAAVDAQRAAYYLTGGGEDPDPSSPGPKTGETPRLPAHFGDSLFFFSVMPGLLTPHSLAGLRRGGLYRSRHPHRRPSHGLSREKKLGGRVLLRRLLPPGEGQRPTCNPVRKTGRAGIRGFIRNR